MEKYLQTLGYGGAMSEEIMAPKTVLFRAPTLTSSGYGVHARSVFRWLMGLERAGKIKLSCQVLNWGDTPWFLDEKRCDGLVGEVMHRTTPLTPKYDVTLQLQLPNEWDPNLGVKNIGLSAMVETDKCNPEWVACCNRMDRIIVPSQFTRDVVTGSGLLTAPIQVVGEPYPDCFRAEPSPVDFGLNTKFNFLVFGQLTGNNPENDRKNIFYTVKWLCEVFKDDKEVGIVVKTNCGRNTKIDRQITINLFRQLLSEVRPSGNPKLKLVHGDMTDSEVHSLLTEPTVKALVALTRGEGFGLPILEASACGLPIIATNWSAHTEFLSLGRYIEVEHHLIDVHKSRIDSKIFMPGVKWAMPIEDQFKRKVKKFRDSPGTPKQWAEDLKQKILVEYSQENINTKYDAVLGDLF